MNFEHLFNDAVEYTRDAFAGHWERLLIFVLLGLPFSLVRFVIDPGKIITGTTIHWELIPWGSIAALAIAGILASFLIGGYQVRVYRGTVPAPDFTGWASLFIDGLKLDIVMLVWFLPALIVLLAGGAMAVGMLASRSTGNPGFIILMILLIPVELILFLVAIFFMTPGAVRFARTGSMAEGWNFSAIRGVLGRIGWVNYIIALVFFIVIAIIYSIVVSIPAMIPYIGWIFPVCLAPLFTVFSARYFTLVYVAGELAPETQPPVPGAPAP
jgi:hypothetical protein